MNTEKKKLIKEVLLRNLKYESSGQYAESWTIYSIEDIDRTVKEIALAVCVRSS